MPDHAVSELPRIAFVFGDAGAAAHLREALTGHVEIAYAANAAEFDAARAVAAQVASALVNLDGGDWLEPLETALERADVPVVFNDPDISNKLDGWERARWLRHLVAKLRGSRDVDPPRPLASAPEPAPHDAGVAPDVSLPFDAAIVERPLSPQEIDSLTADFVAVPAADAADALAHSVASDAVIRDAGAVPAVSGAGELDPEPRVAPAADAFAPMPRPDEPIAADALDIDTEALSAMIDARLAEPEAQAMQALPDAEVLHDAVSAVAPVDAPTASGNAGLPAGVTDDISLDLPIVDDWQLLDAEVPAPPPAAPAHTGTRPGPSLLDGLAGLELVPMESTAPPGARNNDPIERWLDDAKPKSKADGDKA